MDALSLLQQLKQNQPAGLPPGEATAREVQQNVFRVKVGKENFHVKWIARENAHGQNELRIGRLFNRFQVVPAPRLIFETSVEDGNIAGWEWIDGSDLRSEGRDNLMEAFSRLGELHSALRNSGEVVAPPNGEKYSTVKEMLAAEIYRMCMPFDLDTRVRCGDILARLEDGYPTLTHGDMHPGNIIATQTRIWFVDWSFACNSLNLFDLDYVQSIPLPVTGPAWSQIDYHEAVLVLPAYFRSAGLGQVNFFQTHLAVMVWNLLRTYENSVQNGYRAELPVIRGRLQQLLKAE